ncbi:hypothetical protein CDL15_Pgr021601 [Punica granatum]|uniref:Exopolygalacturonase-like n=1 Tax=Punica granatum TaxID=22663 RepID=A0A218WRF0_PUNGR|nr:hypothetical protein CDL15_Pgr021601 [Punica granatum]
MGSKMNLTDAVTFLLVVLLATASRAQGTDFNVKHTGAKANGKSDDSQAILSSWKQACQSPGPSTVVIPKGTYLAGSLQFQGPCRSKSIDFQVQGTIKAPADPSQIKTDSWVLFQNVDGLSVSGGGTFDGQGAVAWSQNDCAKTGKCNSLPINLAFTSLTNSKIQDITSLDSKLFHMNIIKCNNVTFKGITITAPETSLNTDGIHIGRSTGVTISGANIKTGDDCVSLGDGAQQIHIEGVTCGPGHGISIGSLGKYQNEEPVIGVTARNCTLTNTMNGIRVKTWPASPSGVASDLHFEDFTMNNVSTPILIDQQYCPYNQCQQKIPSKVKISKVSFKNIRGTTATAMAVRLVCSRGVPCQGVDVGDINLKYTGKNGSATSECSNVKPTTSGQLFPKICAESS